MNTKPLSTLKYYTNVRCDERRGHIDQIPGATAGNATSPANPGPSASQMVFSVELGAGSTPTGRFGPFPGGVVTCHPWAPFDGVTDAEEGLGRKFGSSRLAE